MVLMKLDKLDFDLTGMSFTARSTYGLGLQGVELLTTGNITLPIPEPHRSWLIDLRDQLHGLIEKVDLPESPDRSKLNTWLVDMYESWWNSG